ncbi:MAG: vitamin B12-dependent ribonucleotide reductase [Chloroflexota bacterium]
MLKQHTRPKLTGQWSESAMRVLHERYLRRNKGNGIMETPEDMCWRVATAIAAAEKAWGKTPDEMYAVAEQFYGLMVGHKFLPNSPTLMNAGVEGNLQYSACFVLPVEDSMPGIFEAVKRAAIIHQSGGGTGFAFSRLRPKGSLVRTSGGRASGPVSFMRVFDAATDAVKQGGRRRGANMGILRVDHPDILEFITCKLDGGITNFNISVAVSDTFMQALERDQTYELIAPHTGEVIQQLPAHEVFEKIVQAAWKSGDPGLVFIDRINHSPANPTPELGQIEATNPCGEQPLLPNEACNLGSINLSLFAKPGIPDNGRRSDVDWAELERVVRLAVRFLDNVIEVNPYPLPEIDEAVKGNRRIGLGVMGWADMLFALGIPYDSAEALALADELGRFIKRIGHDEDIKLAEERGSFPNWPHSIYQADRPRRNATVTTIAPTGSISIIAGVSSGIEPIFALAFRHIVGERRLQFVNPTFERMAQERGFYSPELMAEVAKRGHVGGMADVPADVQRVFVTAHEIAPEWHVRMQAAFQKHTDNGVSKTINLPNTATPQDVAAAYRLAYREGCLGITVFRDGCKNEQVLHVGTDDSEGQKVAPPPSTRGIDTVKPRARVLRGVTYQAQTPLGTAYITVNENGANQPFEVFTNVGKAGSDTAAVAEALGRLISLTLRLPSPLSPVKRMAEVVDQLSGIGGGRPMGFGPYRVRSLPDAIAQVLADHIGVTETFDASQIEGNGQPGDLCPTCGQATLIAQEGCRKCYSCGFSEC